jgi:predicted transcriptional regulator
MPRTPSKTYTDKELEIMRVVWELGEATARQIQEKLPGDRHYNSVLTIIRVLERKGHLAHRAEGKAHVYRARQQPEKSRGKVLTHLIKQVFGGSAASLVLHLVETGDLTEDDLREVRTKMAVKAASAKERPAEIRTATGRERPAKRGKQ